MTDGSTQLAVSLLIVACGCFYYFDVGARMAVWLGHPEVCDHDRPRTNWLCSNGYIPPGGKDVKLSDLKPPPLPDMPDMPTIEGANRLLHRAVLAIKRLGPGWPPAHSYGRWA